MTLTFLGTRGGIDARTKRHYRHTSTLVSHGRARVMIDCGTDWLRHLRRLAPDAIVITHAHPDHVGGLQRGSPCPVHAPSAVWRAIASWPIDERHRVAPRMPIEIHGIRFEAFTLAHSVIAPAVGYRISAGRRTIFYAPDVLKIRSAAAALRHVDLYVGDGATIERPIVRIERRTGVAVGHASIAMQLEWCARAGVPRAILTHCGRAIVAVRLASRRGLPSWGVPSMSTPRLPRTGYAFACSSTFARWGSPFIACPAAGNRIAGAGSYVRQGGLRACGLQARPTTRERGLRQERFARVSRAAGRWRRAYHPSSLWQRYLPSTDPARLAMRLCTSTGFTK